MAKELVSDEFWAVVEPILPARRAQPGTRGRPPVPDRNALTGILFVLKSGVPWEMLPIEMGCGSGLTCWRRLRDWHTAGVWQTLHEIMLAKLEEAHLIDWSRASVDSIFIRAKGAKKGGLRARRLARRLWTEAKPGRSAIRS
jgi:transposase